METATGCDGISAGAAHRGFCGDRIGLVVAVSGAGGVSMSEGSSAGSAQRDCCDDRVGVVVRAGGVKCCGYFGAVGE